MLRFNLDSLESIVSQIRESKTLLAQNVFMFKGGATFTNSPTVNTAFQQHTSFFDGQSGALSKVVSKLDQDIDWLARCFSIQAGTLDAQELASQRFIESIYDAGHNGMGLSFLPNMPVRNLDPILNVDYITPPGVAEATVPLPALIGMFSTDDSAAVASAARWKAAGDQIELAMNELTDAASALAANTIGFSFDRAREAIQDISTTGRVVVGNTRIMEQSMLQFPVVRANNLAALQAIQASTAAIVEPAEKLAAEQAAVAAYVTSTLQPSLEMVRPPVTNLGVPVMGHTGGGHLSVGGTSTAHSRVDIHQLAGGLSATNPTGGGQPFAEQAAQAAQSAGQGNPTATGAPAAGPVTAVDPAGASTAPVNPAGMPTPQAAPVAPSAGASQNPVVAPAGGVPAGGPVAGQSMSAGQSIPAGQGAAGVTGYGQAGRYGTMGDATQSRARVVADQRGRFGASSNARLPLLPLSAQEAQRNASLRNVHAMTPGPVTGSAPGAHNVVTGTGSQDAAAGQRGAGRGSGGGFFGGAGAAGRGQSGGGARSQTPKLRATAEVRAYFLREFMGTRPKKRTVRKVIDRG